MGISYFLLANTSNFDLGFRADFDRIIRNDGLYQYMVYLPKIKMVNRVTTRHEMVDNTYQKFKLYTYRHILYT